MNFRAFFISLLLLTMSYIGKSAYQQSLGENDYPVSYHSNKRVYFASGEAAGRVGDQYGGADAVFQRIDGEDVLRVVAQVGRHLAEELTEVSRVSLELYTFIILGLNADTPDVEPEHLVGNGLYLRGRRRPSGSSPTGQVHHIRGVAVAQHQCGEALAPVGSHLPAHARTAESMNKYQRQLFGICRYLVIH